MLCYILLCYAAVMHVYPMITPLFIRASFLVNLCMVIFGTIFGLGWSAAEVRDVERHYVDGWYTVLYDGEGILDFNMDVTCVHRIARNHIRIWS